MLTRKKKKRKKETTDKGGGSGWVGKGGGGVLRERGKEKKTSQCHELFKGGGLHSRGQCSLTFVTGSEREHHSRWNK